MSSTRPQHIPLGFRSYFSEFSTHLRFIGKKGSLEQNLELFEVLETAWRESRKIYQDVARKTVKRRKK